MGVSPSSGRESFYIYKYILYIHLDVADESFKYRLLSGHVGVTSQQASF